MISVIVDTDSSTGTDRLMDIAYELCENEDSQIVFIGSDVRAASVHNIKFADVIKYGINEVRVLYSFICGLSMLSDKYRNVLIDCSSFSELNVTEYMANFLHSLESLSIDTGMSFTVSLPSLNYSVI